MFKNMKDGEFKTVATFFDQMSAQITIGLLAENGIPAAMFGQDSANVFLNFNSPIEVKVNAADYEAAMTLLEAADSAADTDLDAHAEKTE